MSDIRTLSNKELERQIDRAKIHCDMELLERLLEEQDARIDDAYFFPQDEPVDHGLAYLDRLDGWHGPHHG